MMEMNIDYKECVNKLENLARKITDMRKIFQDFIFWYINVFVRQIWSSQGGFIGEGWKPLSEKYREWKQKRFPGKGILHLTEILSKTAEGRTPFFYKKIDKKNCEFGIVGLKYAYRQNMGDYNLPARPYFFRTTKKLGVLEINKLLELATKYIEAGSK